MTPNERAALLALETAAEHALADGTALDVYDLDELLTSIREARQGAHGTCDRSWRAGYVVGLRHARGEWLPEWEKEWLAADVRRRACAEAQRHDAQTFCAQCAPIFASGDSPAVDQ